MSYLHTAFCACSTDKSDVGSGRLDMFEIFLMRLFRTRWSFAQGTNLFNTGTHKIHVTIESVYKI